MLRILDPSALEYSYILLQNLGNHAWAQKPPIRWLLFSQRGPRWQSENPSQDHQHHIQALRPPCLICLGGIGGWLPRHYPFGRYRTARILPRSTYHYEKDVSRGTHHAILKVCGKDIPSLGEVEQDEHEVHGDDDDVDNVAICRSAPETLSRVGKSTYYFHPRASKATGLTHWLKAKATLCTLSSMLRPLSRKL